MRNALHNMFVIYDILGDPEVTANLNCKSRNLPITDTQNYSTVTSGSRSMHGGTTWFIETTEH